MAVPVSAGVWGQEIPQNVLYVPPGIPAVKERIDAMIRDLVNQGQVTEYTAVPEYKGKSFVPCKIKITASHHENLADLIPLSRFGELKT